MPRGLAIACVTDLHCNGDQYRKIERVADDLCQQYGTVVVCNNGDFVTKIVPGNGSDWIVVRENTDASGSHSDRLAAFRTHCDRLLRNNNVHLVINLGNHEFMHPAEVAVILRELTARGRVHVISNIDPGGGLFSGIVSPSVAIAGMTFVGYCTNDIYRNNNSYEYARNNGYFFGDWRSHNARFENTIRSVNTPGLYIMSHEIRSKSAQYVWPMVLRNCPASVKVKFIATGHDHFDFRGTTSSRFFGDYQAHSEANLDDGFHFGGANRVFFVPPYGFGIGILTFSQFPMDGQLRELVDYNSETRSLSDRFRGELFH